MIVKTFCKKYGIQLLIFQRYYKENYDYDATENYILTTTGLKNAKDFFRAKYPKNKKLNKLSPNIPTRRWTEISTPMGGQP